MRGKGNESSLVIVSRRVLIAGIAGIAIFSFGLGYFLGYGGTSSNKIVKQVEADNRIVASEEKTVLDSSGKPTMVPPPSMPGAVPTDPPIKPKQEEKVAAGIKEEPKIAQNIPEQIEKQKKPAQEVKKDEKASEKEDEAVHRKSRASTPPLKRTPDKAEGRVSSKSKGNQVSTVAKAKSRATKSDRKSDKKPKERAKQGKSRIAKKSGASAKGKTAVNYDLQVGAFEDPSKAEHLRKELSEKGYRVRIATFSTKAGKTFSRVRLGPYKDKKEAEETLSALKCQGMEAMMITGVR